jgi:hypothetical protein
MTGLRADGDRALGGHEPNKKATAEKSVVALLKNGAAGTRWKAIRRRPHPGIDAKTESRDGVRTIVSLRSWLNAFFFGVRLAWLPLSRLA